MLLGEHTSSSATVHMQSSPRMPLVDLTKVKQENVDSSMVSCDKPNKGKRKPAAHTPRLTTRNSAKVPKTDAESAANTEKAKMDPTVAPSTNGEPSATLVKSVDNSTAEEDVPEDSCSE